MNTDDLWREVINLSFVVIVIFVVIISGVMLTLLVIVVSFRCHCYYFCCNHFRCYVISPCYCCFLSLSVIIFVIISLCYLVIFVMFLSSFVIVVSFCCYCYVLSRCSCRVMCGLFTFADIVFCSMFMSLFRNIIFPCLSESILNNLYFRKAMFCLLC